jgi:aryl-alcohol dehydrogenase-like predicted oxidoreductase
MVEQAGTADVGVSSAKPQHIGVVACSAEAASLCYRTICIEGAQLLGAHVHPEVSGTPCLIHQVRYKLIDRDAEEALLDVLADEGVGCIAFSPLAQGPLSERYLGDGIPADSRAAKAHFLKPNDVTAERIGIVRRCS